MDVTIVKCQQFNVNDNKYKVLEKLCANGDRVKKGSIALLLDSSKAVLDVECEADGFFYTKVVAGDIVTVGQPLYIIAATEIADPAQIASYFMDAKTEAVSLSNPASSKIVTKNARKLLAEYGLSENEFEEEIITEDLINLRVNKGRQATTILNELANQNKVKRLALIGAGQGFIQTLDIVFSSREFLPSVVYDDTPEKQGALFYNIPVRGRVNTASIIEDHKAGVFDVIINTVSISVAFRKKIFDTLHAAGVPFGNLIHPLAYVGFNNTIGEGNVIFPQVTIGPCSTIGNDNFISTHCNIEHHNVLGNHCTFGPGVMTSGNVLIGDEVKFGTGIYIEPKLSIGNNSIIASGCIISRNVESNTVAYQHGSKLSFKAMPLNHD